MHRKIKNISHTMILTIGVMVFIFKPLHLFSQSNTILDSLINYNARNVTLYEGLNEIGDIIGYEFSYNADIIDSREKIKANFNNQALNNVLHNLLGDTNLTFYVLEKQIIIRKRNLLSTISIIDKLIADNTSIQINGTIIDKTSGEYLSFANISLLGKSLGTVSNDIGKFNLKISNKNIHDTLVVSFIGYKNKYIPVNQLYFYNNNIYLEEDLYQIKEVVIRVINATEILEQALDKISDNFYTDPYYITSFYREIVTNKNELAAITESVLEVYKSPYLGLYSDQVKIVKSRKNEFYSNDDTVSLKLQGGLHASLLLDVIKNRTMYLQKESFYNYNYKIKEIVNFDDNSAYVINFKPKHYLEDDSFEGNIYVNTDNLAIVAVEFTIIPEAIEKLGKSLVVKKAFRTSVKPTSVKYSINYRKINDKYYMNLARGELIFKVKYRKKLFATEFKTIFEFAVNDIDITDVKRFDREETISKRDVFIDENFQYDSDFWGDYNYITPNETLEEALVRIQQKLRKIYSE
jgi:hypothetical protein